MNEAKPMNETKPMKREKIFLKDYQAPPYQIDRIDLSIDLSPHSTQVQAKSHVTCRSTYRGEPLILQGKSLKLLDVKLDGLTPKYECSEDHLTIFNPPKEFELLIQTEIDPKSNKSCEGLYQSQDIYCTQCEAEGFRRITYYIDRPDNMAIFSTTIIADKKTCPILLSNGNLTQAKDLDKNRHMARWEDPHKKPSYLFALVAGNLDHLSDQFTTQSGRQVDLRIYTQKGLTEKCHHAMKSLKKSMKWDEDRYGLEYDLDIFMIVTVDDFNAGAMENKGLNIFNSKYILANPESATDDDYNAIEAVVAHEYFHNWTGNRVTCRDWFQLSLKEGLTVYRDQEFSSDMGSRPVERIDNVLRLRSQQFTEDGGPNSHPVRPTSCYNVSNFYTTTVYEKGAEVIRMIETLVGREGFRKGMDKYFELFDGQAVTTEDFVHAMEVANDINLTQFQNWYHQAGTPEVFIKTRYEASTQTYTIELQQSCPPTPESSHKEPYHIPIKIGLIDKSSGKEVLIDGKNEVLIELKENQQSFTFKSSHHPLPSILRDFSAPIKVNFELEEDELIHLMKYDKNLFNRWEAGQKLYLKQLMKALKLNNIESDLVLDNSFTEAFSLNIQQSSTDPLFFSRMLDLPSVSYLEQFIDEVDPPLLMKAQKTFMRKLGQQLENEFKMVYESNQVSGPYQASDYSQRALKNLALSYLDHTSLPKEQYFSSNNMTDSCSALYTLNHTQSEDRKKAIEDFYNKWNQDPLVINTWLRLQSFSILPGGIERVTNAMKDPVFNMSRPNNIYSLIKSFSLFSPDFHLMDGSGYEFYANQIINIDKHNPQVAARLSGSYNKWRTYSPKRQDLIKTQMERILSSGPSQNTFEIISKTLQSPLKQRNQSNSDKTNKKNRQTNSPTNSFVPPM